MESQPSKCVAMPEDWLSRLPDDLLHSILHDLPLKQGVRTSAVSRKWASIWLRALATSLVLDFTDRDFINRQTTAAAAATISRFLKLHGEHGAPLDVLRVALLGPLDVASVFGQGIVGWVVAAVARGAKEVQVTLTPPGLDMLFAARSFVELPSDLFLAKNSLVRLALDRFSLQAVPPGAAGFAGLRSLSLNHANVTDEAVQAVLSNCRLLESLSLRSCDLLKSLRIAGEKLKQLEILGCLAVQDLRVAAPALESFTLYGDILYDLDFDEDRDEYIASVAAVDLGTTPALRDAYVSHLGFGEEYDPYPVHEENPFTDFLTCVAHARTLTLCTVFLLMLTQEEYDTTANIIMTNMQELQLLMASLGFIDIQSVSSFFQHIPLPLLDRLFLHLPDEPTGEDGEAPALTGKVDDASMYIYEDDDFVLDRLRFIKVVNFRGSRREMVLLVFLMKRAPALEQLVLITVEEEQGAPTDEQLEIIQGQASAMQRASSEARVTVCRPSEDRSQNPAHTRLYHEE